MTTFQELHKKLLEATAADRLIETIDGMPADSYDPHQLDCLLNPDRHPLILRMGDCECSKTGQECAATCHFDALDKPAGGNTRINDDLCVGCGDCVRECRGNKLIESKDSLAALSAVRRAEVPVYAMIAPAFVNQYRDVSPGKLRTAFKRLGFTGMLEVALFADILTLKEALEFDKNIVKEEDYQLTSCCCPMWIAMIRKVYTELIPHVPGSVSPMVACGRAIKTLHPGALTVFIGPCMAKKAEAREKDVADSTDYVLTFQEMQEIFEFSGISLADMEEDSRDHSSQAGRIYAASGGVSEAVQATVKRLNPHRPIAVRAAHADGVPACKAMLNKALAGQLTANFIEGMGCVGGCVGGPKALIPKEEGRKNVYEYGDTATYATPIDNPYVVELLHRLGFDTVESLLADSEMLTRLF